MKRNRFLTAAALSIVSLCAASVAANAEGDKHDLKPKFAKDSVIKYVMTQDTSGSMKQGEQERKAVQSQTLHLTRKVTATTETSATVELTITRVVASSTPPTGGDPLTFDSEQPIDKDAGNMLALKYRQMVGKPYTLEVALDGTISSVKLPEDSLVKDSAEAMKSTFGPLFQIKQGEPLTAVGESWEKNESLGAAAQGLESKAKLTLAEVKDNVANIAFNSVIGFKEGSAPPGMQFKEAGVTGKVLWNLTDGALVEMNGVQKMNMSNADMALEVNSTTNMLIKREE
jgi:hypothetical protein